MDENGLMLLRCPSEQDHRFAVKINFEGPEADLIYCPYCGHRALANEFITDEAQRRLMEASGAAMILHLQDKFTRSGFKFTPAPMPQVIFTYEQEKTRRTMHCNRCDEPAAVFGIAMFCPGCGQLAPADQFIEMLEIERRTMTRLSSLPADVLSDLEADGSLARIYEDSVENTCAALETFLKSVFAERVPNAESVSLCQPDHALSIMSV
ncbi:hypothetical protein ACQPZQ_15230 [Pseudonocardia sp. CA-142604]|uniref:hypothetical protein n=1 Tax=Pseudonocardia sp. CA-142604 TaxID=3240024 RepID=UPI003D8E206B